MTLVLDEAQVRQVLDMPRAISAMEALCREEAAEQTLSAERIHIRLPRGFLRILPGILTQSGVMGYKEFHTNGQGVRYSIHLFDFESGAPLAMMDANHVTAMRTGALAAVALKYLSPPEATRVGLIGSGTEARSEMAALMAVRPNIRSGRVFSPRPERREACARDMAELYQIEMQAVERPEEAVEGAEIVLVATGTRGGAIALEGRWLHPGLHINSIGSTAPEQREIDPEVWRRADRIVLDTQRLLHESGDALAAEEAGTLDRSRIVEINQVVAGKVEGRSGAGQTTLYKSVGTGLQDVATAYHVYQAAREQGLGTEMPPFQTTKLPSR